MPLPPEVVLRRLLPEALAVRAAYQLLPTLRRLLSQADALSAVPSRLRLLRQLLSEAPAVPAVSLDGLRCLRTLPNRFPVWRRM